MARGTIPTTRSPPQKPHKFVVFGGFKKLNTKILRQGLSEDELHWVENLIPIGHNNWVSAPAAVAALAAIGTDNVYRSYGVNIGSIDYIIVFTISGGAIAINAANGAQIKFAADGTFVNPDLTAYASQRVLIIDTSSAGYSTWDGTLFVQSGGISPNIQVTNGGTYAAAPTVTISGGSGTGATAHAIMGGSGASQFVAQVVLDNPGTGFKPGDSITVSFAPASTTAATARIWPQVTGTTIGIFGGRVWWASAPTVPAGSNVRILNFTGTAGYDDINPANAAGSTTITDSDLAHNITAVRGMDNYLYIVGDNSIRQIGTLAVQSSITLFTPFTISSDIGTTFLMTVASYNRFVVFANKNGVYGIFGATVQKISDDLDGIFQNVDWSLQPSAALNDIHVSFISGGSIHCYLLLLRYIDPVLGPRSIILCFDGKQWFPISQGLITSICSLPLASTVQWDTFAAIGNNIVQLMQDPTTPVNVTLVTSLTPHGSLPTAKQIMHAGAAINAAGPLLPQFPTPTAAIFAFTVDTENNSVGYQFAATGGFQLMHSDVDGYGHFIGLTFTATVSKFTINSFVIEYVEADLWGDMFPAPPVIELIAETGQILTTEGGQVLTPP